MKKFLNTLVVFLLAAVLVVIYPALLWTAEKNIIILHTNDIHCGVEKNLGLSKVAQYKKILSNDNYVLLVDSGDAIQGEPMGSFSAGTAIVKIMNTADYDFAVPGNHEFDYGMENFLKLVPQITSGYYCANLFDLTNNKQVLPGYKMFEIEDSKIAFIGAVTPETLISSTPAYFQDINGKFVYSFCESADGKEFYKQIQKNIDEVKSHGADYVFLVGHLGMNGVNPYYNSIAAAEHTTGLTAVLDGHSHEKIEGRIVKDRDGNDVLIGQTGTKLQSLGKLTLKQDGTVNYELITDLQAENADVKKVIAEEKAVYEKLLQEPVGEALVSLYVSDPKTGKRLVRSSECSLGDFVADAYKAVLGAEAVIVNGGGIRADLEAGIISYNDIMQILPFQNTCMVIEVTGQQLLNALEMGAAHYPDESGAFMQVSGITFTINSKIPSAVITDDKGGFLRVDGKYRVQNVKVNGKSLKLDRKYKLGGISYILKYGGNGMTMFKDAPLLHDGVIETDVLIEYIQNHLNAKVENEYVNPYGMGRIVIK